jgi:hypothetical protein
MRLSSRLVLVAALLAPAAGSALAAHGGSAASTPWTRVSGPAQPGEQLGLARTGDGVLHVIWNRGAANTSIFETRLAPSGRTAGTSTVATGWDGNAGLALLTMPDGSLRLFAAGAAHAGSPVYGINTFTAPAAGGSWHLQSGLSWGGAVANASAAIGAALTRDGQPVTAWRGFAAAGLPPSSVPTNAYQGDMTISQLATDAATGGVVLSGVTGAGKGGVFVQQILPSAGPRVVLPMPFGLNDWNSAVSGRLGASGVYVAYADSKAARLYRYGGGTTTLGRGPFLSATVCAGPAGRLWVAWGDKTDGLFVTRSNIAVGGFEPVQRLRLPQNTTDGLTFVQCEGSTGPLDLFADAVIGTASGFWHTHLLARFSLAARAAKGKVTLSVRDAGDAVPGAAIAVAGKHATTDAHGNATVALRRGSYSATATATGYAPASTHFSVH